MDAHGKRAFYKFLVLPFGLNSACYYFTKLTLPLVAKWRGEGKLGLMYLDDGFGCVQCFKRTFVLGCEIKSDLLKSGFVPKAEKCVWKPVQCLELLGCTLNSEEGTICILERRIFKTQCTISESLRAQKVHRRVPVRKVASIVGQIMSMSIVIGHISQIMTRYLSMDILSAWSWSSFISLAGGSINQLNFWQDHLGKLNFKDIFESHKCSMIVYSDASSTGYAGYEINTVNGISHGV